MSYAELLKDPRWQKKRLEIMERDEWTCQACRDTEATLTVHHKSYRMEKGGFADIWDYDGCDLVTLCEKCHSTEESRLKLMRMDCYILLRESCEDWGAMRDIVMLVCSLRDTIGRRVNADDIIRLRAGGFDEVV